MRYGQKQIDKFLEEAKTSSMDILDLSKKHGIHPHTGNLWVRKFLPKKILESIRARGRRIRALHAAASRIANSAKDGGHVSAAPSVAAKQHAGTAAKKKVHEAKAGHHLKKTLSSGPRTGRAHTTGGQRTGRQVLSTIKARLMALLDDVSRLQAAGL